MWIIDFSFSGDRRFCDHLCGEEELQMQNQRRFCFSRIQKIRQGYFGNNPKKLDVLVCSSITVAAKFNFTKTTLILR